MIHHDCARMLATLGLAILVMTGCGGPEGPELAPVKGTVTYQGKPVENAGVTFTPTKGGPATAQTNAQGEFTLQTLGKDGAVLGDHVVTIAKMDSAAVDASKGDPGRSPPAPSAPPKSLIPVKYAHPEKSGVKQTVKADGPNEFKIDLTD